MARSGAAELPVEVIREQSKGSGRTFGLFFCAVAHTLESRQ
jgi:hypothetical protein